MNEGMRVRHKVLRKRIPSKIHFKEGFFMPKINRQVARPSSTNQMIEEKILILRSEKVMLDRDLAMLYGVGTRDLNKAVSRNFDRFPGDFMFSLTHEEFNNLKFQFGTSSWGGLRKLPRAFTEHGIAMLSMTKTFNLFFK